MKNLIMLWGFFPRHGYNPNIFESIKQELEKYGKVEVLYFKSDIPISLEFGEPKNPSKVDSDESNHAIIMIDGENGIEFFKARTGNGRGRLYDENFSSDISEEIEELLSKYDYYTGRKISQKKIWVKWILILLLLIAVANVLIHTLFLFFPNRNPLLELIQILLYSALGLIIYKEIRDIFFN